MGKATHLSEAEREAIARNLFEVHGGRQGDELHGLCPFHDDSNPSFSYNVVKDIYYCFTCGKTGDLIRMWSKLKGVGDKAEDFKEFCRRFNLNMGPDDRRKTDPAKPSQKYPAKKNNGREKSDSKKMPREMLDAAWASMPELPAVMVDNLVKTRGWSAKVIKALDLRLQTLRWNKKTEALSRIDNADRIAIPVHDADGVLQNIRCYKPGGQVKIFSFGPGTGSARLFPPTPKDGGVVLVVEGEADCICAIAHGFNAVTQTSKTKYWPPDQVKVMAGRDVVIAYDGDKPGQKYAKSAAESLSRAADSVKLLTWPDYMGRMADGTWPDDHGQDLTDVFVRHGKTAGDLQSLIEAAQPLPTSELRNSDVIDFFDFGINGRHSFKSRLLADRLCKEIAILFEPGTGLVYRWNGSYFELYNEEHMESRGVELLGDEAQQSRIRDAVYQAKRMSVISHGREMNDRTDWICLVNGMLNLRTLELIPHNRDYYPSYRLPVVFDPDRDGRCDRFLLYLEETIQTPGPIMQVQEFCGYCLTREVKYEKALLLLGPGADGKSKLMSVMEALVGPENCAAVSFQDLEDQFHRSSLYGKTLNISTEVGNKAMESAYFKAIVSGDPISAAFKHQNAFQFRPYCKLVFAGNRLPRILDNSDGPFRRLLPISFKRQFLEDGDPQLLDKLMAELSDIFHWALVGLHRLWQQGRFTDCEETRELLLEHRRANNPVLCFVEDACVLGSNESIQKDALYKEYKRYADTNGYNIMGKVNFFRELYAAVTNLKASRLQNKEKKREHFVKGICIDYSNVENR